MEKQSLKIVILGLSLSSSWGNGHATTFRSLVKGLHKEGHKVWFLERDVPWYANNRDLQNSTHAEMLFYNNINELKIKYSNLIASADFVMVGSYVPEGVAVGKLATEIADGIVAFYDIDTPVTMAKLEVEDYEYLEPQLISKYDLYLSFTGGPILAEIATKYRAQKVVPLYCSVDTELYYPQEQEIKWDLGYLGTHSPDRQPTLNRLLKDVATINKERKFAVAGPQYPDDIKWPQNVERIDHLPPAEHCKFYNSQRFTLNVTREKMVASGYAPSVRLFEAAACGCPIISDYWKGLETFFEFGEEILIARSTADVEYFLNELNNYQLKQIAKKARVRILSEHSSQQRAKQLVQYINQTKAEREKHIKEIPA